MFTWQGIILGMAIVIIPLLVVAVLAAIRTGPDDQPPDYRGESGWPEGRRHLP